MCTFTVRTSAINERRNYCKLVFMLVWSAGMLAGISAALHNISATFSLMRSFSGRVSIVGLLVSVTFPFVISAVIVSFGRYWLLLPLGFVKAFMFCFCACSVTLAYGSAGWLSRSLLMFSDSVITVLLLWCWLRCIAQCNFRTTGVVMCLLISGAIGVLDYCLVSPLAVQIFNYS